MKKNLEILDYEDKKTQAGKRYVRFKTSEGWMSCFDSVANEKLKTFEGKVACVEVVEKGEYKNLTKCYGEADYIPEDYVKGKDYPKGTTRDEKPEVVKPGEYPKGITKEPPKPNGNHATMYTSYAKDIFCAVFDPKNVQSFKEIELTMKTAIELVKQAKEAFE